MYECCPGWWKMLDEELKVFHGTEVSVKEKYGRADVYFVTESEEYELFSKQAEIISKKSQETCELCGGHGKMRNDRGWIQCRCDRCHSATREERNEIMRRTAAEYEEERK